MDERELLVIGGVGGSGTRLFAEAARAAGRSLDGDLNHALDNLWFTFLFKRPGLFDGPEGRARDLSRELRLLAAGLDGVAPSRNDLPFVFGRAAEATMHANNHLGSGRGKWAAGRVARFFAAAREGRAKADCFKEPNASIFLKPLADHFPRMKYVHVARNGLDMALSDNQQMFHNWGPLFGVDPQADDTPRARLKFWVRLNEEVAQVADSLGEKRCLFARYDDFVTQPAAFAERFIDFVGGDSKNAQALATLAKKPDSFRRYLEVDPATFDADDIEAVRRYGFDVPDDYRAAA